MRIYNDSKVCRFLQSISQEQIVGFLNDWNKKRDYRQRIYISYDSTNKNCQAGDIDILEYGKSKTDTGAPIFNLALAFDKTNRVPLFYETYGGSINDVAQFKYTVDKVIDYGYQHVGFILDKGYFSKSNLHYLEENRYSSIIINKLNEITKDNLVDYAVVYGEFYYKFDFIQDILPVKYIHEYFKSVSLDLGNKLH